MTGEQGSGWGRRWQGKNDNCLCVCGVGGLSKCTFACVDETPALALVINRKPIESVHDPQWTGQLAAI